VLCIRHRVYPGDASEEQRNKSSGAASAQKRQPTQQVYDNNRAAEDSGTYVVSAISCLLRLCLMALAGYNQHQGGSDGVQAAGQVVSPPPRWHLDGGKGHPAPAPQSAVRVSFPLPSVLRSKDHEGRDKLASAKSPLAVGTSPNPSSGPTGAGKGRADKDESVLEVRRVVLQRAEEAEAVWTETCKALADLVSSPVPNASFQASYSLEVKYAVAGTLSTLICVFRVFGQAVLSAGVRCEIPDALLVKVLGDLVQRLPLAMQSPGATHPARPMSVESVAACQRSCNIIFDLVVQKMKVLRNMEPFHALWLRIVSTLAANAQHGAARGQQWWHDEMCDTLEALLRLLRLPVAVQTGQPRSSAEETGGAGSSKGPVGATAGTAQKPQGPSGGLFGWLVAPLIAATEVPPSSASAHSPVRTFPQNQDLVGPLEPSDGYLLKQTWEHISRAYPAFHACLRSRDAKLHSKITAALALPPIYFQKGSDFHNRSVKSVAISHQSEREAVASQEPTTSGSGAQEPPQMPTPTPTNGLGVAAHHVEPTPPGDAKGTPTTKDTVDSKQLSSAPRQQASVSTSGRSLSMSPELREEGDSSLFSISLSDTPARSALPQQYDTPLVDTSISIVMQSPIDTPSFVSEVRSGDGSVERSATSPYVKNLTPIFASAEGPNKFAAVTSGLEESSPVRKMEQLLSPEAVQYTAPAVVVSPVASYPAASTGVAPSTPSHLWQVYPQNTPLSPPPVEADHTPSQAPRPSPLSSAGHAADFPLGQLQSSPNICAQQPSFAAQAPTRQVASGDSVPGSQGSRSPLVASVPAKPLVTGARASPVPRRVNSNIQIV
jgi:hypothetical protein